MKTNNKVYVEGSIKQGSKIKVSIIYGVNGIDGSASKIISWDNSLVNPTPIGGLGTELIGTVSLGATNLDLTDVHSFDIPIAFNSKRSSRYKIKIESIYDNDTTVDSYWAISNIATNSDLQGINRLKTLNSNR